MAGGEFRLGTMSMYMATYYAIAVSICQHNAIYLHGYTTHTRCHPFHCNQRHRVKGAKKIGLNDMESEFMAQWLSYLAEIAIERGVCPEDEVAWRDIAAAGGRTFVSRPDFYVCEVQVVATGTAP